MLQQTQPIQPIPASVAQLAEANHLGAMVAVYYTSKLSAIGLFLGGLALIGFIALTCIALPFVGEWIIYVGIVGGLLALLVIGTIRQYVGEKLHRHDLMVIYRDGLAVRDGPETRVLRWEQIETLHRGNIATDENGTKRIQEIDVLRLLGSDGVSYKIERTKASSKSPSSHLHAKVCDTIESGFVESHLPGVWERYDAGQEISFGEISLSQRGFRDQIETLQWTSVVSAEVGAEWLTIRKEGRTSDWYHKMLPEVPNACLLKEMLTTRR